MNITIDKHSALKNKAHAILLLSMAVSEQGIAHAFASYFGHCNNLDAHVLPADTIYKQGHLQNRLAKLTLNFDPAEQRHEDELRHQLKRAEQYIQQLEALLAAGQPLRVADLMQAAEEEHAQAEHQRNTYGGPA